MSRFGSDYRIGRCGGVCTASGRRLEPGSPCVAALVERAEDEGFDRLDFSVEAWEGGTRPERLLGFWRTTVPDPHGPARAFVDDSVLLELFEALAGDDRRRRVAYRFILALVLMRKKLLRYAGRRGQGEDERWLMVPRGSQEPVEVVNPRLSDDDVRELTEQLGEVLRADF